ncbi:hypothetical protein CHS0354_022016 [Potamilus streckersoni]|uniref:Uncharacterized protein n=1 Tax=Potamilus streckersoni TaxID=2493646 RepID=A0AAE0T2X3_9BIVA|nr:hypothetical protein CHS0354_022016 [Potamilus streckersoni]
MSHHSSGIDIQYTIVHTHHTIAVVWAYNIHLSIHITPLQWYGIQYTIVLTHVTPFQWYGHTVYHCSYTSHHCSGMGIQYTLVYTHHTIAVVWHTVYHCPYTRHTISVVWAYSIPLSLCTSHHSSGMGIQYTLVHTCVTLHNSMFRSVFRQYL